MHNEESHSTESVPAEKPYAFARFGCLALVLLLLVWFSPLGMIIYVIVGHSWCSWRNEGEFDRHRKNYQGLVTAIQAMNLPTNQSVYLRVDPDKNPVSLRPSSNFDKASEQIVARREPDGRLTLRVCTYSMGHAGVYGLFYSSGPPDKDEVKYSFGADGHIDPVGPGWWRVADFTQ